jgi:hypothetical protein
MRSLRRTPAPWSQRATWFERADKSANVSLCSPPDSSITQSAALVLPAAITVEIINRPIKLVQRGPGEGIVREIVVSAMREQKFPGPKEFVRVTVAGAFRGLSHELDRSQ